jgi:hypothetical protein
MWASDKNKAGQASHGSISTMPSLIADLRQVRAEKGDIAYRRSTPRVRSSMTDHWDLRILAPVPLAVAVAISSPLVATPLVPVSSPLLGAPLVTALAPASTAGRQQRWRHAGEDCLDLPGGVSQYEFVWTRKRFCGGTGWGKGNFFSRHELPSTIAFLTNRLHTKANQPCLRCRTSRIYDRFHQQPSRDWCLHIPSNHRRWQPWELRGLLRCARAAGQIQQHASYSARAQGMVFQRKKLTISVPIVRLSGPCVTVPFLL